jgi:hypothetical protein
MGMIVPHLLLDEELSGTAAWGSSLKMLVILLIMFILAVVAIVWWLKRG